MKKFLLLLAVMVGAMTASAQNFWYNGLACGILDEDLATVRIFRPSGGYTQLGGILTIPSMVYYNNKAYTVVKIDNYAFYGCAAITKVVIPKTIESISDCAFYECTGLTTVTFEDPAHSNLWEVCSSAFAYSGLTSINFPPSLKGIYAYAFCQCTNLTSATIPNSVTFLSEGVFSRCSSLQTVNIPTGIDAIHDYCFHNCTSLSRITIPNNVKSIGLGAFEDTKISSLTIPSSVKYIDQLAFACNPNLTTLTIPKTVEWIEQGAFRACGLKSVNIQNDTIAAGEFADCTDLKTVTIGKNLAYIDDTDENERYWPFKDCPIETLTIGSNVAANISYYTSARNTLKTLIVEDGVTDLPENAFLNCDALETVSLPSGLKHIYNSAFSGCVSMGDLVANMVKPIVINQSVFNGVPQHGYCDLHVPSGSKVRYSAMEVWKEFTIIEEDADSFFSPGDVNSDKKVDVADAQSILNIIADEDYEPGADINTDGKVDVADYQSVLNIMAGN